MRTKRTCGGRLIALIAAYLVVAAPARADVPLEYATIEPAQITIGESATFTITNLGSAPQAFSPPVVSGLQFQIIGRTHQVDIINGTTLSSNSIVVRVTPQMAGIFTIPAITPTSQPLVLQVNAVHGTANYSPFSKPSTPTAPPIKPPIFAGQSMPDGIRLTEDGSAFVRLIVPKHEVYVGESVPVEIEVGMRSGFVSSLNGLPKLTGDNFTLNNLSHQPERSEKMIGGEPFVVMTWRSVLAVVKPGTFPLSAEAPLTVKIRTRARQESLLDDKFGDPFLQNFFGATVPKDINVASPPLDLTVLALPIEGRPAEFRGAVGSFKIASDISPSTAAAGDPLTLRMHVTGSGNFDRVDTAMLDHVDQWKTYPPKSSLNLTDEIGFKGEKTFEQPLIASKAGHQTLPQLTFSYFDPSTRRYETAHSSPLSVTISQPVADSTLTAAQVAASAATTPANKSFSMLRPDHVAAESSTNSLLPLYFQPQFLALPSLLALAFAGGWWRTRRHKGPNERAEMRDRATAKAISRLLAQMDAAARSGDPSLFFVAARSALQQALAARWQVAPDQITTADVGSRVDRNAEAMRRLFALADEAKYSGHELNGTDFARWKRVVRHQLTLEKAP
jgi:BatD DUF11 like domain